MTLSTRTLALTLTTLALSSGCTIDESLDLSVEFRTSFGCTQCGYGGSYSAYYNQYEIGTVNFDGYANNAGIKVLGIVDPEKDFYTLKTENDELLALDGATIVAGGAGLIGWTIRLYDGADILDVTIVDYTHAIESGAAGAEPINGYALAYFSTTLNEFVNVCPGASPTETAVTVLGDVRYDEETRTVEDANGWVTLACFGNAAAKMKLMNYSRHSDFSGGFPATESQRQATVRMITADYCGDGTSFTANGVDLDWLNTIGDVTPQHNANPNFADIEAIWTENGALCLSNPRLADLGDVANYCSLPACEERMLGEPHEWVTWKVQ